MTNLLNTLSKLLAFPFLLQMLLFGSALAFGKSSLPVVRCRPVRAFPYTSEGFQKRRMPYRARYNEDIKPEPPYGIYKGDHIYGISPVLAAITKKRRNFKELIVQEGMDEADKKMGDGVKQILQQAELMCLPVRFFPKHDLNMLSDNRPHQGFVLRASPLDFIDIVDLEPSNHEG
jgi:hypothetical protein